MTDDPKPKNKGGRPPWQPTDKDRKQVETMAGLGVPIADVAKVMGVHESTLRVHCANEIEIGIIKANAEVAGFLFNTAKRGNVAAQIFWCKTRMGWKDPRDVRLSGTVGTYDATKLEHLSDDELRQLEGLLGRLAAASAGDDPGDLGGSGEG